MRSALTKMAFSVISLGIAFVIKAVALYLVLNYQGFAKMETQTLVILAAFSTLLSFIMPAGVFDITGMIVRGMLFAIILMLLMGTDAAESLMVTFMIAVISAIMIATLTFVGLAHGVPILSVP
jgi:hypothetical protein